MPRPPGWTGPTQGEIERGEVAVTIVTALKVAQALGMTLAGLFSGLNQY